MTALSVSVPGSISNAGHISRMSSLPSIDEDDSNNAPAAAQHHRRAPSAFSSKPRFSLKSLGSISTNSDSSHAASVSLTSKDLPSNMMTSYKDRDPYEKYTVLESLGKGSIGSVEKVVRRHHHKRHDYNSSGKSQRHGWIGGIFHDCCVISSEDEGAQQKKKPSFLQSLISKLINNSSSDAFESIEQSPSVNTSDSYRSNMSENSAFSAPTTLDHANNNGNGLDVTHASSHPWTSIRSDTPKQRHTAQHTLRRYALKSIRLDRTEHNNSLSKADEAELRNEISILRQLDHPHIVHILEVYYHKRAIYLLIDLCEGGDLYVMDPYVEGEARSVMKQLCMAVSYMHRRGVVHRDLKYENVMFVERAERSRLSIKLIDFGLSMKYGGSKKSMSDFVGTIYTMAPEVIRGNYNYKADLWSLMIKHLYLHDPSTLDEYILKSDEVSGPLVNYSRGIGGFEHHCADYLLMQRVQIRQSVHTTLIA